MFSYEFWLATVEGRKFLAEKKQAERAASEELRQHVRIAPLIRWNSLQREWVCSDTSMCFAYAWGASPEEAYERWLKKFAVCYSRRRSA